MIASSSFAQNINNKDLLIKAAPCIFEMTINNLTSQNLQFNCKKAFDNKSFKIENFRLKIQGYPSTINYGNTLSPKSKSLLKKIKSGDFIDIFYIKSIIFDDKSLNTFKSLKVRIIE